MATIPESQKLTPVGEGFGEKRFIGLEIETTRSENFFPKPEKESDWNLFNWSMTEGEKEHIKKTLDPEGNLIAMVGKDGDDIEIATQPFSHEKLDGAIRYGLLKKINLYCIATDGSGTHIHISKLPKDKQALWKNLYWFETVFDKQFYAIFRRKSHWAISPRDVLKANIPRIDNKVSLKKAQEMNYPQHGMKGTIIVKRKNTYECRAGSSSTSPKEIVAWAMLFYNIVEFCNQSSIIGHRFEEVLPEGEYGELLKMRLTGEQLRQIVPIDLYL